MPKASTFYAGRAPALAMNVFVKFQHSSKAWEVGRFTVNIIISKREGAPNDWGGPFPPEEGQPFTEGSYRVGHMLGRNDKWWRLKDDSPLIVDDGLPVKVDAWRPTSYDDYEALLTEAVADVTRDVCELLGRLGGKPTARPRQSAGPRLRTLPGSGQQRRQVRRQLD
jgi:hypothetical protein